MLLSLLRHASRDVPGVRPRTMQRNKRDPSRHRRRGVALAGTLCAALGLVAAPAAAAVPAAGPAVPVPAVPTLDWQPCDSGFFCATATVPLDYAHPTGTTKSGELPSRVLKRAAPVRPRMQRARQGIGQGGQERQHGVNG